MKVGLSEKSWVAKDKKPPFPHAELMSIKELCEKERIDLEGAMARMKKADISFKGAQQRLAFIARDNNMSAREIFLIIKGE